MIRTKPAGFFRPFLSGFAIGAVALAGFQLTNPGVAAPSPERPFTIEQVR